MTQGNRVLDKCYGNINNACTARAKPPLANSDHNVVHLIPTYESCFKSIKPQLKTAHIWDKDGIETLRDRFSCTDRSLFHSMD